MKKRFRVIVPNAGGIVDKYIDIDITASEEAMGKLLGFHIDFNCENTLFKVSVDTNKPMIIEDNKLPKKQSPKEFKGIRRRRKLSIATPPDPDEPDLLLLKHILADKEITSFRDIAVNIYENQRYTIKKVYEGLKIAYNRGYHHGWEDKRTKKAKYFSQTQNIEICKYHTWKCVQSNKIRSLYTSTSCKWPDCACDPLTETIVQKMNEIWAKTDKEANRMDIEYEEEYDDDEDDEDEEYEEIDDARTDGVR